MSILIYRAEEDQETYFSGDPCTKVSFEGASNDEAAAIFAWLAARNCHEVTVHMTAGSNDAGPGSSGEWQVGAAIEFEVQFDGARETLAAFEKAFPSNEHEFE
jgi:hypothetical protein